MRILAVLTDAFGGHGGIALYNRDLLTALCSHPDCTEVVAIPRLMPHPSETRPEKLTYVTTGLNSKSGYVKAIWETVRNNPAFDLIICGHINLLPIAFAMRLWLKAPLLLEIYGIDAWQLTRSPLSNMLVRNIDAFISISEITKKHFLSWTKLSPEKGFLLPNAIHKENFGPGPKNPELIRRYGLKGKNVLMTMGRLVPTERYKGFDEVMEVLPELIGDMPDIAYLIVGCGADRARLERKTRDLGVAERVVFTGFVDEKEKADHFRLADVYVMPSKGEGFGFVFLEALACGLPVIASKIDGGREAVRGGALGQLVDPGNAVELKAAILAALRGSSGAVPPGLDYFSFSNFYQRLHGLVDTMTLSKVNQK